MNRLQTYIPLITSFLLVANLTFGQLGQFITKEDELFAYQKAKIKECIIGKSEKRTYEYGKDKIVETYIGFNAIERTEYYFNKQKRIIYTANQAKYVGDTITYVSKMEYKYAYSKEILDSLNGQIATVATSPIKYLIVTDTIKKTEETYFINKDKSYDFSNIICYDSIGRLKNRNRGRYIYNCVR